MDNFFESDFFSNTIDRVDGKAKVTGTATYSAEYKIANLAYGVLVGSTIAKGKILSIDTKAAERAPGVKAVITHLNSPKIPGYQTGKDPAKPPTGGQPLRIFYSEEVYYYDQPIALIVADTFERARYAALLIKAQYQKQEHVTGIEGNLEKAKTPTGPRFEDYTRGTVDGYKNAEVVFEQEYYQPIEVHNPMEPGSIIAVWEGEEKVTVYTKTQGVQSTQRSIRDAFQLKLEDITVHSEYVGGAFGMALRTWPYEIAAIIGAKKLAQPVKLVLTREQMFTNVGSRPGTFQKIGLGATRDGKLTGLTHEASGHTSTYEEFTEATVNISRFLYACPNVTTRYRIVPIDTCTPIWMRGPGEATGCFALESAMDELAYKLKLDPIEFRLRNHADTDPERNLPWSSKYLKDCYELGAAKIGWNNRKEEPATLKEGEWLVGYGMGTGAFGAFRSSASVRARLAPDGKLLLQCSVNDMGPGTATMMTKIASDSMGIKPVDIKVQMGSTGLPPGPTQGGSATTSTVGSAVLEVCTELKKRIGELALKDGTVFHNAQIHNVKIDDLVFSDGQVSLARDPKIKMSYSEIFSKNNAPEIEVLKESRGGAEQRNYSMYSYSVHFVKVLVHPTLGITKLSKVVSCADVGTIINQKTAESQMSGGAIGGIGMAMMEEVVVDHRFGRFINNNLADYHVPVNADIPNIDVIFVNKKDPYTNAMGSKGLGEVSLIGIAPAIANAIFNATGKRIRRLPLTLDKLI